MRGVPLAAVAPVEQGRAVGNAPGWVTTGEPPTLGVDWRDAASGLPGLTAPGTADWVEVALLPLLAGPTWRPPGPVPGSWPVLVLEGVVVVAEFGRTVGAVAPPVGAVDVEPNEPAAGDPGLAAPPDDGEPTDGAEPELTPLDAPPLAAPLDAPPPDAPPAEPPEPPPDPPPELWA